MKSSEDTPNSTRGRRRRPVRPADWSEDDERRFRFDVITTFFSKGNLTTGEVVLLLKRRWPGVGITRESLYPIVEEAIRKEWLVFVPPKAMTLSQRIADLYRLSGERRVHVVADDERKHVAAAAAELIYRWLKKHRAGRGPLSVLLGAGSHVALVARYLGAFLRSDGAFDWQLRVIALVPPESCSAEINPLSFARYLEMEGRSIEIDTWPDDDGEPVDVAICQPLWCDTADAELLPLEAVRYQGFQLTKLGASVSIFFVADRAEPEAMRACLHAPQWHCLVLGQTLARELVADYGRTQFNVF